VALANFLNFAVVLAEMFQGVEDRAEGWREATTALITVQVDITVVIRIIGAAAVCMVTTTTTTTTCYNQSTVTPQHGQITDFEKWGRLPSRVLDDLHRAWREQGVHRDQLRICAPVKSRRISEKKTGAAITCE